MSFPTRERGLKHALSCLAYHPIVVVPYAGTWIETNTVERTNSQTTGRSLRGNVD